MATAPKLHGDDHAGRRRGGCKRGDVHGDVGALRRNNCIADDGKMNNGPGSKETSQ
jgi:hypothetical protein